MLRREGANCAAGQDAESLKNPLLSLVCLQMREALFCALLTRRNCWPVHKLSLFMGEQFVHLFVLLVCLLWKMCISDIVSVSR